MNTGPHSAQIILHCHAERKCTWKQQKVQFTGPIFLLLNTNKCSMWQMLLLLYPIINIHFHDNLSFSYNFQSKRQIYPVSSTGTSNNSIKRTVSTELGSSDCPYFSVIIIETSQPGTMLQSATCLHQWACCSSENTSSSQSFMLISCNSHI